MGRPSQGGWVHYGSQGQMIQSFDAVKYIAHIILFAHRARQRLAPIRCARFNTVKL